MNDESLVHENIWDLKLREVMDSILLNEHGDQRFNNNEKKKERKRIGLEYRNEASKMWDRYTKNPKIRGI